jgi:hypothetical protein
MVAGKHHAWGLRRGEEQNKHAATRKKTQKPTTCAADCKVNLENNNLLL